MKKPPPKKPTLKRPVKRSRRNPYQRALDRAVKALDRALDDKTRCMTRLIALEAEIPKLQGVIGSLESFFDDGAAMPMPTRSRHPSQDALLSSDRRPVVRPMLVKPDVHPGMSPAELSALLSTPEGRAAYLEKAKAAAAPAEPVQAGTIDDDLLPDADGLEVLE